MSLPRGPDYIADDMRTEVGGGGKRVPSNRSSSQRQHGHKARLADSLSSMSVEEKEDSDSAMPARRRLLGLCFGLEWMGSSGRKAQLSVCWQRQAASYI